MRDSERAEVVAEQEAALPHLAAEDAVGDVQAVCWEFLQTRAQHEG